ncbi:MAG: hypothetical protein FIB07_10770 [Candidatus Methanoperedens sp.]|nr:hypothetical protein [Candidatus Methanoperedens sp.]
MEEKSGKSHSFEEITLAITILTGLSFFLFKIADYFNNNIVRYSPDLQLMIGFLVIGLLIEMTIISSFLILKGHAISLGKKEECSIYGTNWTKWLFKLFFKGLIGLSAFSFALVLVIVLNNVYKNITIPIINYNISTIITSIIIIFILYRLSISIGLKGKIWSSIKKFFYLFKESKHKVLLSIVFVLYTIAPIYVLMGSYSIDVFPQSNVNDDILTFTVKETGLPYNNIYIYLYKLNSSSDFFWLVDNVTINNTKEALSNRTFMLGKNYDGVWYLNINTSKLQHGNYLLHAEITDDLFKRFLGVGISKKQDDKLFYIPPNGVNNSVNSTRAS